MTSVFFDVLESQWDSVLFLDIFHLNAQTATFLELGPHQNTELWIMCFKIVIFTSVVSTFICKGLVWLQVFISTKQQSHAYTPWNEKLQPHQPFCR